MKLTKQQKNAINKICENYDFENARELKAYIKEQYGDTVDYYWFTETTTRGCYEELEKVVRL